MSQLFLTAIAALIVAGLATLAWWLLIESEGVYLGRSTVIWLYDLFANRYDDIKALRPDYEHLLIARPVMQALQPHTNPFVLDVATGTGRLPLALLDHTDFEGRIIAVDLARRMLRNAAYKLGEDIAQVDLIHTPAECLPFDDDTFDLVSCLEAFEFMMHPATVLTECIRVLRPGGLLFVTNRVNVQTMPGKVWTQDELQVLLEGHGLERIIFEAWQSDYDKVWGYKPGSSDFVGARPLDEVMRCPRCRNFTAETCSNCGLHIPRGDDGVLELASAWDMC